MNHDPIRIIIVNGPNLDTLGLREPTIYGSETHDDLVAMIKTHAVEHHCEIEVFQSNAEHELINRIQKAHEQADALIVNLGAFTHTSLALRDALLFTGKPFIEVHISNVFAREAFRHKSTIADVAEGVIAGIGFNGYLAAIAYFAQNIRPQRRKT